MNFREVGRALVWTALALVVVTIPVLLVQQSGLRRETITIRSYPVTPEIASEMKSALTEAIVSSTKDGPALGRVSLTADGQLLVTAPESIQKGVERILAEVAAKKPSRTPSIHFEVWLVSAVPGTAAAADEPSNLAEVRPALADIQKSRGPLRFELVEKLALQARAGDEDSQVRGAHSDLRVVPTVRQDSKGDPVIAARIQVQITAPVPGLANMTDIRGSLKALAELRPGQLLVIGQSSLPGTPLVETAAQTSKGGAASSTDAQVYYIVRASL